MLDRGRNADHDCFILSLSFLFSLLFSNFFLKFKFEFKFSIQYNMHNIKLQQDNAKVLLYLYLIFI